MKAHGNLTFTQLSLCDHCLGDVELNQILGDEAAVKTYIVDYILQFLDDGAVFLGDCSQQL